MKSRTFERKDEPWWRSLARLPTHGKARSALLSEPRAVDRARRVDQHSDAEEAAGPFTVAADDEAHVTPADHGPTGRVDRRTRRRKPREAEEDLGHRRLRRALHRRGPLIRITNVRAGD